MNNDNHLGGSYMKVGTLKPNRDGTSRHVQCQIASRKGGPREVPPRTNEHGRFGPALEIPVSIEGQEFVISIPADKGDGLVLKTTFGPDLNAWIGHTVDVFESEVLDRIRVVPVN